MSAPKNAQPTVTARITGSFGAITLMLLVSGLAGFHATQRLSDSLHTVSTTAWGAADAAMGLKLGLQEQPRSVARQVGAAVVVTDAVREGFRAADPAARTAVEQILASGLSGADLPARQPTAARRPPGRERASVA